MKERIKELVKEINETTEKKWEELGEQANADSNLETFFQKWCWVNHEMEKRFDVVANLQKMFRQLGYDVKMNMQNYNLSYYGTIKEEQ